MSIKLSFFTIKLKKLHFEHNLQWKQFLRQFWGFLSFKVILCLIFQIFHRYNKIDISIWVFQSVCQFAFFTPVSIRVFGPFPYIQYKLNFTLKHFFFGYLWLSDMTLIVRIEICGRRRSKLEWLLLTSFLLICSINFLLLEVNKEQKNNIMINLTKTLEPLLSNPKRKSYVKYGIQFLPSRQAGKQLQIQCFL